MSGKMTILDLEENGSFVIGWRVRQCGRTLLTDYGVLTCQRRPKHPGNHATIDEDRRLVIAVVDGDL